MEGVKSSLSNPGRQAILLSPPSPSELSPSLLPPSFYTLLRPLSPYVSVTTIVSLFSFLYLF